MIYVRDKGRMCNNILQYGHVYAWGREHGRTTLSMRFAYKYPYFHICHTRHHNFMRYLIGKWGAGLRLLPVVAFNEHGADCSLRDAELLGRRNMVVEGWEVRYYDLFLKYLDEIRELFAFEPEVEHHTEEFMREARAGGFEDALAVGLHVRRGDYATWNQGRYLFSWQQYADVARSVAGLYPGCRVIFFICGNDPHPDRRPFEALEKEGRARCVFAGGNPGEDLCMLSYCDLLAGAPSTFSLVAAMYRDLPLYWIEDTARAVRPEDFKPFATLFRQIK